MSLLLLVIPEWLELVSLSCCIGVFVCSLWVVDPTRDRAPQGDENLIAALWPLSAIAAATLFGSSIVGVVVRSADMSGKPVTAVGPVLPTVLFQTHVGKVWTVRLAAVLTLLVTTIAARRLDRTRWLSKLMLGCIIVVAATETAAGHPADAGDFSVAEMID